MQGKLTPQKRVNKNGVAVTKYVRLEDKASSGSNIPMVSSFVSRRIAHFENTMYRRIFQEGISPAAEDALRATLHAETFQRCADFARGDISVFDRAITSCVKSGTFTLLNNMGVFGTMCDDECYPQFDRYVAGLNGHVYRNDGRRSIDYSYASEAEVSSGRAVLHAIFELEFNDGYAYVSTFRHPGEPRTEIISQYLTELIEKRPQDVERILSLLKERSLMVDFYSDIDDIEEMLDSSGSDALLEGVL